MLLLLLAQKKEQKKGTRFSRRHFFLLFSKWQAGSLPAGHAVLKDFDIGETMLGVSHCLTDSA